MALFLGPLTPHASSLDSLSSWSLGLLTMLSINVIIFLFFAIWSQHIVGVSAQTVDDASRMYNHHRTPGPWNARKIQRLVLFSIFNLMSDPLINQAMAVRLTMDLYPVPRTTLYNWLRSWRTYQELPYDTSLFYHRLRVKSKWVPIHGNSAFTREH